MEINKKHTEFLLQIKKKQEEIDEYLIKETNIINLKKVYKLQNKIIKILEFINFLSSFIKTQKEIDEYLIRETNIINLKKVYKLQNKIIKILKSLTSDTI